ncbi:unnamed protein product, partial [Polarella glacialis]
VLVILQFLTGLPGAGCCAAGLCLLVPVLAAELRLAKVWDELLRRRVSVQQLLRGTGGAVCGVELDTGIVLEASDELLEFLGQPRAVGRHLTELVRLAHDRDRMAGLLRTAGMAAAGRDLEPLKVTSLRAECAPQGVVAQLVPYDVSMT